MRVAFRGCRAFWNTNLWLFVYIEDLNRSNDGTLSPNIPFTTPSSNAFVVQPTLMQDPITADSVEITFTSAKEGFFWAQIIRAVDLPAFMKLPTLVKDNAPATTLKVGGDGCYAERNVIQDSAIPYEISTVLGAD